MRRALAAFLVVLAGCGREAAGPVPTTSTAPSTTTTAPSTTTTAPAPARPSLQSVVDGVAARQPVPFGVVAVHLGTGERAERLAGRQVLSASLYKLFVAQELMRRVRSGALSADAAAGDGRGRTVAQCVTDMIVVSDDPCGVAGLRLVGRGAHDAALAREGYGATRLASPQRTSAADVALFLTRARSGDPDLYGLLRRQQVRDRFPAGLPPGTPIAHKTGDRTGWAHDAGVISTPSGDVLLVALSGPWAAPCCHAERPGPAEARAFRALADLAAAVHGWAAAAR